MPNLAKAVTVGLAVGLGGTMFALTPFGWALEQNVGLDWLFSLRGQRAAPADVVIVSIDRYSAEELNFREKPIKWPRAVHAALVDKLKDQGARSITFDIMFREKRSPAENEMLAGSISSAGNVILFEYLDKRLVASADPLQNAGNVIMETLVPPTPTLATSAVGLAPMPLPKVPAKINQLWLFKTSAGSVPTIPAVTFQLFALPAYDDFLRLLEAAGSDHADALPPSAEQAVRNKNIQEMVFTIREMFRKDPELASAIRDLAKHRNLDDGMRQLISGMVDLYAGNESLYLNFYGPARSITTVPYSHIVGTDQAQDLSGKAVFVGLSETMQLERVDSFYTPFSQANGIDLSGVEIGATAFANLLDGSQLRPLHFSMLMVVLGIWGLVLGGMGRFVPMAATVPAALIAGSGYLFLAHNLFKSAFVWMPVVVPLLVQLPLALLVSIIWRYADTKIERQKIRTAFGYYIPNRVVDQIANDFAHARSSSRLVQGVCLATDAAQYTSLAESMNPNELGKLMNDYYARLFDPVQRHQGFVSDVVGDAMMAIWTATDSAVEPRREACRAALEIKSSPQHFRVGCEERVMRTRIGVHYGEMLLGNVGAGNHYEYRAVGDIVNTASRIQALNKYLKTQLLVSGSVLADLDGFLTRDLGRFLLAGKSVPIHIFEVLAPVDAATSLQRHVCTDFVHALEFFKQRDWDRAKEAFADIDEQAKGDGPARFYMNLVNTLNDNPPPSSWDGVVIMGKK